MIDEKNAEQTPKYVEQTPKKKGHKKLLIISIVVLFAFIVLGIGAIAAGGSSTNTTKPQQTTTAPAPKQQTPQPKQPQTATDIVQSMKQHGLPIGSSFAYTAANDENHLLGRPGQYISKVNFIDTRLPASGNSGAAISVIDGGSVEVFATQADAQNRLDYLKAISSKVSLFAEYDYLQGKSILRLSHVLTPDQAAAYNTVFSA